MACDLEIPDAVNSWIVATVGLHNLLDTQISNGNLGRDEVCDLRRDMRKQEAAFLSLERKLLHAIENKKEQYIMPKGAPLKEIVAARSNDLIGVDSNVGLEKVYARVLEMQDEVMKTGCVVLTTLQIDERRKFVINGDNLWETTDAADWTFRYKTEYRDGKHESVEEYETLKNFDLLISLSADCRPIMEFFY